MKKSSVLTLALSLTFFNCGKETVNSNGDNAESERRLKNLWNKNYNSPMTNLPLFGKIQNSKKLWSGDQWSLKDNSINKRWMKNESSIEAPTAENFNQYTKEEIAQLSPSEKFDLLQERFDYPLRNEVAKILNPNALNWEGLGNGWAAASTLYDEPQPKILKSPNGVEIPFGSSDIKALLSYYYSFGPEAPNASHLGLRCFSTMENSDQDPNCLKDLNPRDFHLTLVNEIGLKQNSIIADVAPFDEVWNQPIVGYNSEIIDTSAVESNTKKIKVKTIVEYVAHSENSWEGVLGTSLQKTVKRTYLYELILDEKEKIIDGTWMSQDRPDFIWKVNNKLQFNGYFDSIKKLLE